MINTCNCTAYTTFAIEYYLAFVIAICFQLCKRTYTYVLNGHISVYIFALCVSCYRDDKLTAASWLNSPQNDLFLIQILFFIKLNIYFS